MYKNEKKINRILLVSIAVTLLLIGVLMFTLAIYETVYNKKYIYNFDGVEVEYGENNVIKDGVRYVDMNRIAGMFSMTGTVDGADMKYSVNGTHVIFENGSDTACVNSIAKVKMNGNVIINENGCWVPVDAIKRFIPSLSIKTDDRITEFTRNDENKSVYIMTSEGLDPEYENDLSAYKEYIQTNDDSVLLLANKVKTLGQNYIPENLIVIPSDYRKEEEIKLCNTAEKALEAMMLDARTAGVTDLYVTSAYRSYQYQQWLFENYVKKEMEKGVSREEAEEIVLEYSAKQGTSEHQTGLCIDFTTRSIGGIVEEIFETTEAYTWLSENCWKYGFILRYPKDKTDTTKYNYEPWHYRFVGLDTAALIYQTGLCFEEYLEIIK